jgi:hypothetical protein
VHVLTSDVAWCSMQFGRLAGSLQEPWGDALAHADNQPKPKQSLHCWHDEGGGEDVAAVVLRSYAAVLLRMQHICCLSLLGFWALQAPSQLLPSS